MAEVDVSSYKYTPPNMLDTAAKINQLESQGLTIGKQKLDLLNQKFQQFNKEIVGLAEDPNLTPDAVVQRGQQMVKSGFLDKKEYENFINGMPTDQNQLRTYVRQAASRALSNSEAINFHYGQNSMVNTGAAAVPLNQRPGMAPTQSGLPIQNQLGPAQREELVPVPNANTGGVDATPKEEVIRRTGGNPNAPDIVAPVTPGVRLPVAPVQPQPQRTAIEGQSPELEGSLKALNEDRAIASSKMQSIKPMIQAINLIGDLKTGIGTETYNKARAAMINAGLIDASANDPTVIYQEINKKLSNYISQSAIANRSDAGQALAAASSPNVQGQLNPALIKLARDVVALDRIEAAKSLSFDKKLSEFKNNQDYSKHRSNFPQSVDEKAFSIDLLPPDERNKLIEKYADFKEGKLIAKKDAVSKKFWDSLAIAKSTGVLNPVQ